MLNRQMLLTGTRDSGVPRGRRRSPSPRRRRSPPRRRQISPRRRYGAVNDSCTSSSLFYCTRYVSILSRIVKFVVKAPTLVYMTFSGVLNDFRYSANLNFVRDGHNMRMFIQDCSVTSCEVELKRLKIIDEPLASAPSLQNCSKRVGNR